VNKIKKYQLDLSSGIEINAIGLITDEIDYKLCWLLNKNLGLNLVRTDDFTWLSHKLPNPQSHPAYVDLESQYGTIRLIRNKSEEGIWIKGYQQVDFLLVITEPTKLDHQEALLNILRGIKGIRGIYQLDANPLVDWID